MKIERKIKALALAGILFSVCCPLSAAAEDAARLAIPVGVTSENLDGREIIVKVYKLPASEDPAYLIEEPFEQNGFVYAFESITKEEKPYEESKTHSETLTVSTASGNLADVLGALSPTLPYDDGTYGGTLALDHTSIKTEAAGYTTKSHTVSETKTIEGLDRNDPGYVPKSTVKNGRTLTLSNIEWSVGGAGLAADGALLPSAYTAIATYTAGASVSVATGYVTTATYTGRVVSEGVGEVVYTVIYAGKPAIVRILLGPGFLAVLVALLLAIFCAVMILLRRNTRIYTPEAGGAEYELIGKCRLRAGNPHIDLSGLRKYPRGEAIIEVEGRTARRMFGRVVRISLRDGVRTHLIEQTGNENYWFTVSTETEKESEVSE
ncbi:MAG: hypothetical protein LBE16_05150 [Clostridiales Family XIII bacterium]|nr:hypothetical protein [Clostridiales Family XIII bacterium]